MKEQSQQKVWNKIAQEWYEFKTSPSAAATEFLNQSKGKILDFGSGTGRNLLQVKKSQNQEFYLVDFSKEMLKLAEQRAKKLGLKIQTRVFELNKTDFPNDFFDAAICFSAIHCIETNAKRKNSIKELFRILKPGAKAKISVWNKNSTRFKNKKKKDFVAWRDKGKRSYYFYTPEEIKKDLQDVGFKIISEDFSNTNPNITITVKKPISS